MRVTKENQSDEAVWASGIQIPRDLALVVKELRDERVHLHAELAVVRAMLESHDPSLGRRKRATLESDITDLLAKIKVKDDQIYNLYDVLEGQQDDDITEQFVEGVTEEIRQQDEEVEKEVETRRKEKKVTAIPSSSIIVFLFSISIATISTFNTTPKCYKVLQSVTRYYKVSPDVIS